MNNYNRYTFKAKRKDNQEWVYGSLIIEKSSSMCLQEYGIHFIETYYIYTIEDGNNHYSKIEIKKETLCQCTGLQDKDGNYIFENDIVIKNNIEFRVDWSYGGFEFSHDYNIDKNCDDADYINPIDYKVDECKIISNKFDKEVE